MSLEEVLTIDAAEIDPHMHRFIHKLLAAIKDDD